MTCDLLVLQRKPFAFDLFFCLANVGRKYPLHSDNK